MPTILFLLQLLLLSTRCVCVLFFACHPCCSPSLWWSWISLELCVNIEYMLLSNELMEERSQFFNLFCVIKYSLVDTSSWGEDGLNHKRRKKISLRSHTQTHTHARRTWHREHVDVIDKSRGILIMIRLLRFACNEWRPKVADFWRKLCNRGKFVTHKKVFVAKTRDRMKHTLPRTKKKKKRKECVTRHLLQSRESINRNEKKLG